MKDFDFIKNKFRKISFSGKQSLALLAAAMALTAGIGSANAYFTTYAEAQGGLTIHMGNETEIEERFDSWTKHVVIDSESGSEPVYVRVKAFCGSEYSLVFSGAGWSANIADQGTGSIAAPGDSGFYYCTDILYGDGSFEGEGNEGVGGKTSELLIEIKDKDGKPIVTTEDSPDFNVVVIYECTPVLYDEAGNPYADWTRKVQTGNPEERVNGGGEG